MAAYEALLAETFAGRRGRPDGGEPAGTDPRQPADGALEQVRLAGSDDRQQVGDVGRLLDPLRRLGGRFRGHQGHLQDAASTTLRAGATSATAHPIPVSIIDRAPSAELRDGPARRPVAAALRRRSTRSSRGYVEEDLGRDELIARGPAGRRGRPGARAGRPRRVQAPPGAARDQDHRTRLRARPAHADHQPLPRLRIARARAGGRRRAAGGRRGAPARSRAPLLGALGRRHRAHRDRHARGRAQAPVVVAHVDVPDPGRAAAVAARRETRGSSPR